MSAHDYDIAIAGAGIVGTSTALHCAMRGMRVLLADPEPPGSGTSSGNACTIATYGCLPVNDPSVLRGLPNLLTHSDSPLSVSPGYLLRNPGWALRFLANCRTGPSRRIAEHLADLLSHADAGLNALIAEAGAADLVEARGQLQVWSSDAGAEAAEEGLRRKRALGITWQELTVEEARALEPGLALPIARAVLHPEARSITDPRAFVERLHARFEALGGTALRARVGAMRPEHDGVTLTIGGQTVRTGHAVNAAGAFAKRIPGSGAERVPLGTERGYHLMFATEAARVTRPVGWAEGGFYASPTAQGLRLAGTVEIASPDAPPTRARLDLIARRGAEMLGPLPEPSATWLGYRPTLPDSLPMIGPAPGTPRILHAFGHQHLGLTLGGITGRVIADLAGGRQPDFDIAAFAPGRRFTAARA